MISEHKLLNLRTFFLAVFFLSSIGLIATDIYLPSLPIIERDLLTIPDVAKLTLTLYLITFSLSQLFYGPLSDRIGRRKTAFLGLLISLFGSFICTISFDISTLILGRMIQGLGLGAGSTLARAIRRDVHSGNDLAHFGSFIIIGTSITFALAPTIGGYIQHFIGWRYNFLLIMLYTLIGMVGIAFWLPETNKELNPLATKIKSMVHHYVVLLKSPIFMGYSLCSSLGFGGLTAYLTSSPFIFENILGLTPVGYGRLAIILALGLGLGGFYNQRMVKTKGRHKMLVIGVIAMALAALLMFSLALYFMNIFVIMFPMLLYSFGAGITFTNAFAGAFHHFGRIAGFVGALYGCIQIFGGALASGTMAFISFNTQMPLCILLVVIGVATYFLQKWAYKFSLKASN